MTNCSKDIKAIVLAAGKGTRMKSQKPKVLHEIFSKPLVGWVLRALGDIEPIVVAGHGFDMVQEYLSKLPTKTAIVEQKEQLGTGHAVMMCLDNLKNFEGNVIILCGDTPLITKETLEDFIKYHNDNNSDLTVMSAIFENPFGYGRIIRSNNNVVAIVEEKDADVDQKSIKEVNAGIYLLNWNKIKKAFNELQNNNAQNEYYLTDIISWAVKNQLNVQGYVIKDNTEIFGINSREQLAIATSYMNKKHLKKLMIDGVTIVDPDNTYISPETIIEQDTVIFPSTYIEGVNKIGSSCKIGPMAHLRGNCIVGNNSKIGNFVELKNATIGEKTNACHLSYIGDSEVGNNVNIGAGTITANYNSITKEKNKTILKDGVSVGSNCVLVAPVTLNENAFVGALSSITKDVEKDSLALTRSEQKEYKNWVKNKKGIN
ncbi:MAG: bifunctional UDP-N-acetylglucosamine diphosphorylase/glucosamine-1-phosphate N-acetyltransferase GlmU [Cyanobacteria bacterium SIG30]|nr:bifunctional UDP-N-acetylglucosamine diphosphorylase/glucosamine-1-phosphate N-acetyltransferase GlmU [Cyanobacteria bacterium SIG30]